MELPERHPRRCRAGGQRHILDELAAAAGLRNDYFVSLNPLRELNPALVVRESTTTTTRCPASTP